MAVKRAAFATLVPRGAAPRCIMHALPNDVDAYLEEHVEKLAGKALTDEAPPGSFDNQGSKHLFDDLGAADATDFERLATHAAVSVHGAMDHRANPGLFVALSLDGAASGTTVALLKLEARHSAAQLLSHPKGVPLAIVTGLVDQPGELQMGAAFPDSRGSSDVVVGQRLRGPASAYFLTGLGLKQMEYAKTATKEIVRAVYRMNPRKADAIAQRLAQSQATTARAFVDDVPDDVLTPIERQQLTNSFERKTWPIDRIVPSAVAFTRTLEADGITISGSTHDMEKVRTRKLPSGEWSIEIVVGAKPKEKYT